MAVCQKQGNPVRFFTFLRSVVARFNKPQLPARLASAVQSWLAAYCKGGGLHGTTVSEALAAYRTFADFYKRRAGSAYAFDRSEISDITPQSSRVAVSTPGDIQDA